MANTVDFTVTGMGPFPADMLRFDECWPVDAAAAADIEHSIVNGMGAAIRLRGLQTASETRPTNKRWESFNWRVVALVTEA